ncbi:MULTISPECIES: STAS/SEC14 domain-containing protein [unclassified Neptuniibacter]|uniref:STAS/SEC14 domain-containing protein n=1 Tax=unclassified Neptuniibacter TaxID=2630693 RepID=UPI0025FB107B|nr:MULTISPECIES: STAS/SEC14 domain-containing protein [unclassified Neptuniibacter]|tara:strand:- start:34111 stop:34473 length:363 start_codon:yes stop_codon:yes gene_type:complete
MLKMLDIGVDNAVAFEISGVITEADMSLVLDSAKERSDRFGQIVFFEKVDSLGGVEFSAVVQKFKYLYNVGISNIDKIAIVTDKAWMKTVVEFEDKIFTGIDMRFFLAGDEDEAIAFLNQ